MLAEYKLNKLRREFWFLDHIADRLGIDLATTTFAANVQRVDDDLLAKRSVSQDDRFELYFVVIDVGDDARVVRLGGYGKSSRTVRERLARLRIVLGLVPSYIVHVAKVSEVYTWVVAKCDVPDSFYPYDYYETEKLVQRLESEVDGIKEQLDSADAARQRGESIDGEWYRRASDAARHRRRIITKLEEIVVAFRHEFFLAACRELDVDTLNNLLDAAATEVW